MGLILLSLLPHVVSLVTQCMIRTEIQKLGALHYYSVDIKESTLHTLLFKNFKLLFDKNAYR